SDCLCLFSSWPCHASVTSYFNVSASSRVCVGRVGSGAAGGGLYAAGQLDLAPHGDPRLLRGALLVQRGLGGEEPRTCTARWFPGHPSSFLGGRSSSRSRILARVSWGSLARARAASARAR